MKNLPSKSILLILIMFSSMLAHAQVPAISSVSPGSGAPGDIITITGSNFSPVGANNIIYFGGVKAQPIFASTTALSVPVPLGATYAPITVTVGGLSGSAGSPFDVTFASDQIIDASTFASRVDFAAGNIANFVAVGDLDGDGKLDMVVVNAGSSTISVYRNTSVSGSIQAESFAPRVDFVTGANPITVAIGDLDGDGKLDLAVANAQGNSVSILRNTSSTGVIESASFAPKFDVPVGSSPIGVALGDLDGDGRPELVTGNFGSGTVSVLRNTSVPGSLDPNSFAAKVDLIAGGNPHIVAIGDLDRDGRPDLAVATFASSVAVLRNIGAVGSITSNSFAAKVDFPTGSRPTSVAVGDLDGDGRLDMATTDYSSGAISVLRNTSTPGAINSGSFAPRVSLPGGDRPYSLAIGDLDGDGRPEIAVAVPGGDVVVVYQNSSTIGNLTSDSFSSRTQMSGPDPNGMALGDMDGDGRPDLVVANYVSGTVSIFRNNIPGPVSPTIISQPQSQTVVLGSTAILAVTAAGTGPLHYQWRVDAMDIPGATNSVLVLTNVQFSQSANYSVTISNQLDTLVSSNALLTVVFAPAPVRVISVGALAGGTVQVPVELGANGNENAVGFSLNFDPTLLTFTGAVLPAGAPAGTSLIVNSDQVGSGKIGLAVGLPADATFPAGTQQVVLVGFNVGAVSNALSSPISFSDTPTLRQLSDTQAGILAATYSGGVVSVLPTTIRVVSVNAGSGASVTVPIELLAEGNENAIGFSLNFNPALLSFTDAALDIGAPAGAVLVANTNDVGLGRLGLAVGLSAGAVFPAATQQIVQVTFTMATVFNPVTTAITFGDSPTARQVSDIQAHILPSVFFGGNVAVTSVDFEGDVAARPAGDKTVSIIDWVQMGRFVASLDSVDPGEFQRADCAPRSTRGNGAITITDWVQAGRYAAGLDPLTPAGGPATEGGGLAPVVSGKSARSPLANSSSLIVNSQTCALGTTGTVVVSLAGQGSENAVGFSLSFDTAALNFVGAQAGVGASNVLMNVNTDQVGAGRVGVALALSAGKTFGAGVRELVTLRFVAAATGAVTIAFGDMPVRREISDARAESLPAIYQDGSMTVRPVGPVGPPLGWSRSGSSLVIFWPLAGSDGFDLESSPTLPGTNWTAVGITPFPFGDQKIVPVTIPGGNGKSFFRLKKP